MSPQYDPKFVQFLGLLMLALCVGIILAGGAIAAALVYLPAML